jgi:hypothetical protein
MPRTPIVRQDGPGHIINANDGNEPDQYLAWLSRGVHTAAEHGAKGDGSNDDSSLLTNTDAAAGATGVALLGPTSAGYRVAQSTTFSAGWDIPPGAQFKLDAGKTLALNGPLRAGAYQIFSGAGTVVLGPGAAPDGVRPEWWGSGAAAFQAAITAAEGTGQGQGKVVCQPGTTYTLAGGLTCKRSTIIELNGATITCTSTTATLFTIATAGDTAWQPGAVRNGSLSGAGGTSVALQIGSGTENAQNCAGMDLNIYGFGQGVVFSSTAGQAYLDSLVRCSVSQCVNEGILISDPGAENIMLDHCKVFANGNAAGKAGIACTTSSPPEVHINGGSIDGNGNGTVGQVYVPAGAAIELYLDGVHMEWTSGSAFAPCTPHLDIRSAAANPSYVRLSHAHLLQGTGGSVKNQPLIFIRAGELVVEASTLDGNDLTVGLVTLGDANNEAVYCRTVHSKLYNAAGVNAATQYHSIVSTAVTFEWSGNQINAQVGSLSGMYYTTSGAQHTFKDVTGSGIRFKYTGDGGTTPSKTFQVTGGHARFLNDAGNSQIWDIDDLGMMQVQHGTRVSSGVGVPTIPGSSNPAAGDLYIRVDTPTVANQKLYFCTVGGATPTWVGIL